MVFVPRSCFLKSASEAATTASRRLRRRLRWRLNRRLRWWLNRRLAETDRVHGFAGLPLISGSRVVGVLSILFGEPRDFGLDDKQLIEMLADHAAIALDMFHRFGGSGRAVGPDNLMKLKKEHALADIAECVTELRSLGSPKVGITGFCMGGALSAYLSGVEFQKGPGQLAARLQDMQSH